tara:strand:- start:1647 stop:3851 length:2205 start_codon:yes stop_codon:yes gene_type:complete
MKEVKNIWMGTILVFVLSSSAFAQNKKILIPELDAKKNTYILKFNPDPQNEKVISAYMEGETELDSLRFKAEISKVVERVMVTVITKDPSQEIKIDIVKNNWHDVKRSGKTTNGIYQISFDTAEKFGIVLTSSDSKVPFNLGVWTSGAIIPKSNLFYAVNNSNSVVNTNLISSEDTEQVENNGSQENNNTLYYIVALLAIIAILLVFILLKKKSNKSSLLLILFLLSQTIIYSNARRSSSGGFQQAIVNALKNSDEFMEVIFKMDDYASALNALQQGMDDMKNYLDEMDKDSKVDMDPAGQPSLPSSCLSSYTNRDPNIQESDGNENDVIENENDDTNFNDSPNEGSNRQNENQPIVASGNNANDKPDNGPGVLQNPGNSKPLQLPQYDTQGNLKNPGDFPNAPSKINPTSNSPLENPFIEGGTESTTKLISPEYDRNGNLKDPGDYPNAPLRVDPETGIPIMNPFVDGSESTSVHVRQPKYSKEGNLIDPGDFPDAPQKIDPNALNSQVNPSTNDESEQSENSIKTKAISSSGNGGTSGSPNLSSNNPNNTSGGNSPGSGGGRGSRNPEGGNGPNPGEVGGPGNPGDGKGPGSGGPGSSRGPRDKDDTDKKSGCACLEKAYKKLDNRRFLLEQLRIITANIDRYTDYKIKFGDDVSSVHGVVGIVWQNQKIEILKAMKQFDITYEKKHEEMIADLHQILLEIDRCEAMLGFENWYSNSGFIYYSFMKDKYKRN